MVRSFSLGNYKVGEGRLLVAAGPCVLESLDVALEVAQTAGRICSSLGLDYVFKSSFDKANRTSIHSYRGPGMEKGLNWLAEIKAKTGFPILTDIHEPWQAARVAEVADILQIPAFLCRQTDLLVAAAKTGKVINIKKGQFLSPWDMAQAARKCMEAGNNRIILCERGTTFGYNQLVVDMRSLPIMRSFGYPVMFDGTHSVQMPGGQGERSGGDRRFVLPLVRAAVAVGIDALFLETHPEPDKAKSDGPNMVLLSELEKLLKQVKKLHDVVQTIGYVKLSEEARS
ncbi:2-dehydro-3-deoxyphosphooctonate aldolase [Thermovirga lienii DSM 17291]|jgi:2-dehydro-3-deoxyphosphooctonate aldolase (KDO 8-P synthase)|uniref:2-dehydro-3-deoxyphosphooctonate aldolase n=1 Tax=Thermovirga lienii (strain ATCC BAA-1197 / DSM 17291 / Cas60314) TaxID=580340 RepID=G7V8D2_THELD|nr:3-deoxy-8-phosphooctulonate synthase [Thermovirga lienii]MDN5319320.1 2-dehydro-3-deoxyphosphooctonate aldolase synthase [Thermovirga sp.]AER66294.1 2-dehydro-3-deoxyphosphooctonate aldolase [Thermovirga lienii DSM 17291]KUK42501.1 MAG: 2-dehydro-3-deoxyphosphooctonate aldolase [Thermovirga lienii]MDN5368101.1 2-dehydro-3-deoxyphosphooctonate aldolase synthase [Thermovirga sp.]HCD71197.1 3-deoxy-8-phosphooctulonate synthase [Thermovirga lienii]